MVSHYNLHLSNPWFFILGSFSRTSPNRSCWGGLVRLSRRSLIFFNLSLLELPSRFLDLPVSLQWSFLLSICLLHAVLSNSNCGSILVWTVKCSLDFELWYQLTETWWNPGGKIEFIMKLSSPYIRKYRIVEIGTLLWTGHSSVLWLSLNFPYTKDLP